MTANAGRRATAAERELAAQLLGRSEGNVTPLGPADAAVELFTGLGSRVRDLLGDDSYSALLKRAVHLARLECPDLTVLDFGPDAEHAWLNRLRMMAPEHGVSVVRDCVIAVLANLLWLLVTFLGADLTERLIAGVAWNTRKAFAGPGPREESQ